MSMLRIMWKLENERDVFQEKQENTNYFSAVWEKIVCLTCNKEVICARRIHLCHLYETMHKGKFDHLGDKLREDKFCLLKLISNMMYLLCIIN
jgi:hypothetical protein